MNQQTVNTFYISDKLFCHYFTYLKAHEISWQSMGNMENYWLYYAQNHAITNAYKPVFNTYFLVLNKHAQIFIINKYIL